MSSYNFGFRFNPENPYAETAFSPSPEKMWRDENLRIFPPIPREQWEYQKLQSLNNDKLISIIRLVNLVQETVMLVQI